MTIDFRTSSLRAFMGLCLGSTALCVAGTSLASNLAYPAYTPDKLPPNPVAGQCYTRVEVPTKYSTRTERVVVKDGHVQKDVTSPQFQPRDETILVKEASTRFEVRQPVYESVTEQVMTRPSHDVLSVTPPQFTTRTETILGAAPQLVWKRGNPGRLRAQGYRIHATANDRLVSQTYRPSSTYGTGTGTGNSAVNSCGPMCEIWCLVEEPGQSVSYNRRVMTSPGIVSRTTVPPVYQTITKQVVVDPGGVREIPVPAEYSTLRIQELTAPAGVTERSVPAVSAEVLVKDRLEPAHYVWYQIACKPNTAQSGAAYSSTTSSSTGQTGYRSSSTSSSTSVLSGTSSSYGTSNYGASHYSSGGSVSTSQPTTVTTHPSDSRFQSRTYGGTTTYGTSGSVSGQKVTSHTPTAGYTTSGYTARTYGTPGGYTNFPYATGVKTQSEWATSAGNVNDWPATSGQRLSDYGHSSPEKREPARTRH